MWTLGCQARASDSSRTDTLTRQEDVVEAEVPDGGKVLPVGDLPILSNSGLVCRGTGCGDTHKCTQGTGHGAANTVILGPDISLLASVFGQMRILPLTQLWNSSTVRDAAIREAPSRGAMVRIIFQYLSDGHQRRSV